MKRNKTKNNEDLGFEIIDPLSNYAQLKRIILRDMNRDPYRRVKNPMHFMKKFPKDKVARWIDHPEIFQNELIRMSRHLYQISPHYKRLIQYFATMHLFSYIVLPHNFKGLIAGEELEKYSADYYRTINYIDKMNLRHELEKIFKICFREDVFYGYKYESKDTFYLRQLPPEYCKITCIEDGCFLFDFDFTYFITYPEDLATFGDEFVERYEIFKNEGVRWQTLDSKRQFCIKLMEDVPYPVVPFLGVFEGIYDIDDYKALKKAKAETDNYKVIALKIPTNEDGEFIIDEDKLLEYYAALLDVLPENIGAFLTPMDSKDYSFENAGTAENNNVNNSIKTFWNDAGVSSLIFGDENKTSATLNASIKADMQMVFSLSRQIERNINRLLKMYSTKYKFKIEFLDVTYFNKDELVNQYLKLAQSSLPATTMACAASGLAPIDMIGMNFIETQILKIHDKLRPLSTSYTQSGDEGGAPTAEEREIELSDAGEQSRDNNVNAEY
jgi:hypothetical protein